MGQNTESKKCLKDQTGFCDSSPLFRGGFASYIMFFLIRNNVWILLNFIQFPQVIPRLKLSWNPGSQWVNSVTTIVFLGGPPSYQVTNQSNFRCSESTDGKIQTWRCELLGMYQCLGRRRGCLGSLGFKRKKRAWKVTKTSPQLSESIGKVREFNHQPIGLLPSQSLTWNHKMTVSKNGISKLPGDDFQVNLVSTSGVFF